jgi:DNA invertase Pin-like site-specific DNA recombinase
MARKRNLVAAVGYLRTSSATNVGADKDSERRQRLAIERYAKQASYAIVDWFNDPAVSGADPLETRPGFAKLLDRIEGNGVRVVLVEDASRFARDLIAQELGVLMLLKRGVRVVTSSGDDLTDVSDPSRIMMRQIAGSFAEYEKNRLVRKLREARERSGNLGGRKSYAKARPETVALAKQLHEQGLSYRRISAELAARGHLTGGDDGQRRGKSRKPYAASAIQRMLER